MRGLYLVVTDRGVRSWTLIKRVAGSTSVPEQLGSPEEGMGLAAARKLAREWSDLIKEGKDPTD